MEAILPFVFMIVDLMGSTITVRVFRRLFFPEVPVVPAFVSFSLPGPGDNSEPEVFEVPLTSEGVLLKILVKPPTEDKPLLCLLDFDDAVHAQMG